MPPEGTAAKSALYKPLHELTEDDIAQITREDCRCYLKEKGMRRPSWNKSQAIQQVIMLKTLLETTPGSEGGSPKRICFSRLNNVPNTNNNNNNISESVPPKGIHKDAEDSMSAGKTSYCRQDLDKPDFSTGCLSGPFHAVNNDPTPSRFTDLRRMPVGQMTIFYCGKVNVYDDVPEDKARSILNIAASPVQIAQEQPFDGTTMMQPLPCFSKAGGAKARSDSAVLLPALQTVEGPSTRKASVQRYLDKKKYRFKSKRRAGITSCATLDIYFYRLSP